MTEREALSKMVPPSKRRPAAYMGGIIQVWVTRNCDRSCFGCTQGSNLRPKRHDYISLEHYSAACKSLKDYWGVVGMFGGNPAMHPQFEALCDILRQHVPFQRRGLWSNNPLGKGEEMRRTFNPTVSNLNVHQDRSAYEEFKRSWPECDPVGLDQDSRHSPPYVALKDVEADEGRRWELISGCDINQHWSAMIGVFQGKLRAWFCEVAGAQSMLHQDEDGYPDTGVPIYEDGTDLLERTTKRRWWQAGMGEFQDQVRKHCHECGIPLRGHGELANADINGTEQVSDLHQGIYFPKGFHRVQLVTIQDQLGSTERVTDYLQR